MISTMFQSLQPSWTSVRLVSVLVLLSGMAKGLEYDGLLHIVESWRLVTFFIIISLNETLKV